MQEITVEQSGGFVELFGLEATHDGPLAGLRFAVKDLIDVAGHHTGCGNPTWQQTHPPAAVSAVCVEQLLAAGAQCAGKTVTDELAFSLLGENHFYGTPLNPAAPDRVPGGSSSGSASAVACGLADFAIGTDTGGSVRVPASNCGVWGWRPSHGAVSAAGVMPLAPTFDTVGILARDARALQAAARVLLADDLVRHATPGAVHIIAEAFALPDADVNEALQSPLELLRELFGPVVRESSLAELCGDPAAGDLTMWLDSYRILMAAEVGSCLGSWIHAAQPEFGPVPAAGFEFVRSVDRTRIGAAIFRRTRLARQLANAVGPRDLLCLPTTPTIAPLKGTSNPNRNSDYYRRTLSLTAIAGVSRLPQVSMPLAATAAGPIGLSLIGAAGEDAFLLELATQVEKRRAG